MSKFILAQDSSQITSFLECPQKWLNYYIKRLEPVGIPSDSDEAMNSGTYGHKLLDIYYKGRVRGLSFNDSLGLANSYNPDNDICECGCTKEFHCPIPELGIEECRRCQKCVQFRPKPLILNSLVRAKVRKRIAEYALKYRDESLRPLSEQHLELGFSENIYEDSENLFLLEGRIDLVGKDSGLDVIVDHKFQGKTHWLYLKSIQFKNYALISKVPMVMINYIRLHNKVQDDTLVRDLVTFNSIELAAWHKRVIQIFFRMKKVLQQAARSEKEIDKNWNACSGGRLTYDKNMPQYCWYTTLCEEMDQKVLEAKEKQLFKIKENPWRPW